VPTAWEDWPLGIASGRYDVALVNIAVTEQRKEKFDFATYRVDSLAFSVKSTSEIQSIKSAEDLAGKKVIVGSGTNQERILLGWNEENKKAGRAPALPVYLHDDASGNLYIQSGRADVFFGPQSVSAYKAALTGKTRVVGLGPKKPMSRPPPKKAMSWCTRCRPRWTARLSAVITRRCWRAGASRAKRWRSRRSTRLG
jgi:polar amino acid transport system substrate-binding protein